MIVTVEKPKEWVSIITKCRQCVYYSNRLHAITCSDKECHGNRNESRIDVYYVESEG